MSDFVIWQVFVAAIFVFFATFTAVELYDKFIGLP